MQEQLIWGLPLKDGEDFKSTSETACNSMNSNKIQIIIKSKTYHSNFSYVCQYACPGDERMKGYPGAGGCHQSAHPAVWLQEHLQGVHRSQGLEPGHGVGDSNLIERGIPSKGIPARLEGVYWVLVIEKSYNDTHFEMETNLKGYWELSIGVCHTCHNQTPLLRAECYEAIFFTKLSDNETSDLKIL